MHCWTDDRAAAKAKVARRGVHSRPRLERGSDEAAPSSASRWPWTVNEMSPPARLKRLGALLSGSGQAVSARGKTRGSPATRRVSPETNRVVENIQGGIASRSIAVGARPRRWMTSRLETADRQGGTVTRAGGNTCALLSARLELRPRGQPSPHMHQSLWHAVRILVRQRGT